MTAQLAAQDQDQGETRPADVRPLPSGRSVVVRTAAGQEEIEIRTPEGEVEVRIALTADGPVVQLRAARLQLEATEAIEVNCTRFAVQAREEVRLQAEGDLKLAAAGDLRVDAAKDTHINGKMIYLNC